MDTVLHVEVREAVVELTMRRPEARNAINAEMRDALIGALGSIDAGRVRAVLLRAEGTAFCAGADVSTGSPVGGVPAIQRMRGSTHRLLEEVLECPVPVVAAVQGACAGYGMALALAADFCVVAHDAPFVPAFGGIGLAPDGAIAATMTRAVGLIEARRILLLGERLSGTRAAEIGLVHASVGADELDDAARGLARRLAEGPTAALGLAKGMILRGTESDISGLLREERFSQGLLTLTQDHVEAVAAFRNKQQPQFHGH